MASTFSSDLKLELMTTGEKSGTWGTVTNTNLQQLEQAASGYIAIDVASSDVALSLADGAISNGKNLYFKLTGTLAGNRNVTMPDSSERVFVVEDATTRSSSNYTLTIKTVSGTGVSIPAGSKQLVYSDGTNVVLGMREKGYYTVPTTTYTAVNGDQLLVDTSSGQINAPCTITMPSSPSVGNEIHFIDSGNFFNSNNLTITSSDNILGSSSDLVVSVDSAAFTLVYVNATRGWAYKDNI